MTCAGVKITEFAWVDVKKYKNDIIAMQKINMYVYHYPDMTQNEEYILQKVLELEHHLKTGKTFFFGAVAGGKLCGFIWIYETMFLDEKRMIVNSLFVRENIRGGGLGNELLKKAKETALERQCTSMSTHYAVFNTPAGFFYRKHGFKDSRIEMVCKL